MGQIYLPEPALKVLKTLQNAGYEAYAVGGCVRDALMGKERQDVDITTSAMPEEVKALFRRTIDTGIEHGTVTVLLDGQAFEVTTFRTEGMYTDHRRPDHVNFHATLEEDLSRRDFTVNAMAYSPERGIIDPYGGRADLAQKIIRCVGDPNQRFSEDALRILRAVRFSARLDFSIEPSCREAMVRLAEQLRYVSRERVLVELTLAVTGKYPDRLRLLYELGLAPHVSRYLGDGSLLDYQAVCQVEPERAERFAALLWKTGASNALHFLTEMKADNDLRRRTSRYIEWMRRPLWQTEYGTRMFLSEAGRENAQPVLRLMKAAGLQEEEPLRQAAARIRSQQGAPVSLSELCLNGRDIMQQTGASGTQIGKDLAQALSQVLEDPALNRPDTLIALLHHG